VFTDSDNTITFEVADIPNDIGDKYIEFAKFVTNPYEKTEILRALSPISLSDYYMIFTLMEGEMWIPVPPVLQRQNATMVDTVCENLNDLQEYINNMFIDNLSIDTIEEEPEISDPD